MADLREENSLRSFLEAAPADDEPVTDEDLAAIREGLAEKVRGETVPQEEVKRWRITKTQSFMLSALALFVLPYAAGAAEEPEGSRIVRRLAGAKPALQEEATTGVGEAVYSEFDYEEVAVARLRGTALVDQHGTKLAKGTLLEGRSFLGADRWCKFQPPTMWICLQDRDDNGDFDKALILGGGRSAPHLKAAYAKEWLPGDEGFRRELLYFGAGGGMLRLTYREYVNDFARPAFTQEATYDLAPSGPTRITFQGAEIEVLEAGNSGIRYKVLTAFRPR